MLETQPIAATGRGSVMESNEMSIATVSHSRKPGVPATPASTVQSSRRTWTSKAGLVVEAVLRIEGDVGEIFPAAVELALK